MVIEVPSPQTPDVLSSEENEGDNAESAWDCPLNATPKLKTNSSSLSTPSASSWQSVNSYVEKKGRITRESDGVSADVMVPEGLVDMKRLAKKQCDIQSRGTKIPVFVTFDKENFTGPMDEEEAKMFAKRSACLVVARGGGKGGKGQAALIVEDDGTRRLVTAKHVLQSMTKKIDGNEVRLSIHMAAMYSPLSLEKFKYFSASFFSDSECAKEDPGCLLRDNAHWAWNIDIAWSLPLTDFDRNDLLLFDELCLENFTMVPPNFVCEVGQKIGLVVYNRYPITPDHKAVTGSSLADEELTEEDLEKVFGPGQAIVIHRSVIQFVGENHIGYMINTYGGCSGAIVFLLEEDNENYGKAIGVHAGKHNGLGDISIAFKFPAQGQSPP